MPTELPPNPNLEDFEQLAARAFHNDDAAAFRRVLERYPMLKVRINEPVGDFDSPPIIHVRSRAMLDVLLNAGADINARSGGGPEDSGCSTAPILTWPPTRSSEERSSLSMPRHGWACSKNSDN